jgi:uncharacterized glyoxalase superfamily protein PhnB
MEKNYSTLTIFKKQGGSIAHQRAISGSITGEAGWSSSNKEELYDKSDPGRISQRHTVPGAKDARKAIEFCKRAFGAQERFAIPGPDGKWVMHAEFQIGNSIIMMSEENPQRPCKSAQNIKAGAQARMPVQEMLWGDRAGTVQDPFGYSWTPASRNRDLTMQEIPQGAQAFFCKMAEK